ncbi:MAG: hypothetical protein HRK26_01270 [Rickettsiaceae bacterium H1]|nr:hypothetical protein [Rickettsiaceae bacterium H1]
MQQTFKYLFEQKIEENKTNVINEKEIIKREKNSFEKGYLKAQKEFAIKAEKNQESEYPKLLKEISNNLIKLTNKNDEKRRLKQFADLALSIGEKLASVTIEKKYYDVIEHFAHEIEMEINENIVIKINNKLVEKIKKNLNSKKLSIIGESNIKKGDCIIEWKNGKIENILENKKTK